MSTEPDSNMDPSRELYATLGLTGFGAGNGPTRKRRVDEAFTALNANSFNPDASGSNSVPLGIRRKSDDSGTPGSTSGIPGTLGTSAAVTPAAATPAQDAATGADADATPLAATSANQDPARDAPNPVAGMKASEARKYWKKLKRDQEASISPGGGLAGFLTYGQSLAEPSPPPARPTEDPTEEASIPDGFTQPMYNASGAMQDPAYFMPSFIEDPWSRLLSSRG